MNGCESCERFSDHPLFFGFTCCEGNLAYISDIGIWTVKVIVHTLDPKLLTKHLKCTIFIYFSDKSKCCEISLHKIKVRDVNLILTLSLCHTGAIGRHPRPRK